MRNYVTGFFRHYAIWNDFKLVCFKRLHSNSFNTPGEHMHDDFHELVIVASGSGSHSTAGKEWLIHPGNVFLIPPHQKHCYTEYDNLLIYNLLFSPQFITQMLPDLEALPGFLLLFHRYQNASPEVPPHNLVIGISAFREILNLLEEMNKLNENPQPGDKTLLISDFTRIMYLLSHNVHMCDGENSGSFGSISQLMAELQKDIAAPWDLNKMAKFCNMGLSSFRKKFLDLAGTSPVGYLLRLRLNHAAAMLENSSEKLSRIVFICGFKDVNYFSRQFKKYFNITPSNYHKKYNRPRISDSKTRCRARKKSSAVTDAPPDNQQ